MATYYQGSDLPDLAVTWRDSSDAVIDFSTDHTFEVKVARKGSSTAAFTKTSGITGAATAPNVVIAWAATGELNALDPGVYDVQISAKRDADGKERIMTTLIHVRRAIA